MKSLELRIHPPIVALISAGIIWLLHWLFPRMSFSFAGQKYTALLLVLLAVVFGSLGILIFLKHSTTTNPTKPETSSFLVTEGVYKITRNPMYLGLLFGLLALVIYFGNIISILGASFFMSYITRYQIMPEERILKEKFGQDYENFLQRTRRWL